MGKCVRLLLVTWLAVLSVQEAMGEGEPLVDSQGQVIFEGRKILLDSDTYPRRGGRFVSGPAVERDGQGYRIRFALDQPDDVLVRIVDESGATLRTLGCGMLGANAPEPLQADTLEQSIYWDGRAADGKPAGAGARVQVGVGLTPRFEGFVGYDPGQLLSEVIWLEVDPQGRVYAQLATGRKTDPVILRFDRDGQYIDMAYPSNPEVLAQTGQRIEDLWPFVAHYNGEAIPHRPRSWPTFVPYRADSRIPFPMRIAGDGTVYIAEATTGYPKWASEGELYRLFTTHVERFWFLQLMPLMYSIGPLAIDEKGYGYIVTSTADRCTGTYPDTLTALNDSRAPGTIRKVNLQTGRLQADFEYNGEERLSEKSAYLGVTQTLSSSWKAISRGRRTPDPAHDDHQRFPDLVDLSVDPLGRLLVVDGFPRRLKVYEPNGRFLGEVSGLKVDGRERAFADLRGVAWVDDGYYLLATFRDDEQRAFLARCSGDVLKPRVTWAVELDGRARHVAVDRGTEPPLVWVGMGGGAATLARITDRGERGATVQSFGGVEARTLRYPWNIAADSKGSLYVYDRDRDSLVRTDEALGQWKEVPLKGVPISMLADEHNRRLLLSFSLGENGGYSQDRLGEGGFLALDLETLERLPLKLQPVYQPDELASRNVLFGRLDPPDYPWAKTYGGQFAGVDRAGYLYVRDADHGQPWHKATPSKENPVAGVVRKYGADGAVVDAAYCRLFNTGGGVAMDSRGNFYAVELPLIRWHTVVHDFTVAIGGSAIRPALRRGETPILSQSGFTHLVKMGAGGGSRDSEAELWAHRGASGTNGGGCYCDWPDMHVKVDAADRVFVADVDLHMVKVLDTAGNMLARIGSWGNAETVPQGGSAAELGFRMVYSLATSGDNLFVSDKDLRRISKLRMEYRETKEQPLP